MKIFNKDVNVKEYIIILTHKCNANCLHCYDIKNNESMDENTLLKSCQYICDSINKLDIAENNVQFIGGEIGIYNQNSILNAIHFIKDNTDKKINFHYMTNLLYQLTDEHIKVIKECDTIITSYDYKLRFNDEKKRILWFNNVHLLQSLNKNIKVIFTIHKYLIKYFTPSLFFDFILSLGINDIIFNNFIPTSKISKLLLPKNEDVREWLYQLFLIYEKIKKFSNIKIGEIENLIHSFDGKYEAVHARICSLTNTTILPNGDITDCPTCLDKKICNILTNEQINPLKVVYEDEQKLNEQCLKCKYLKYCKGNCHLYPFDDTGCVTPYKIYDYLEEKRNIL